jgi:hypothetical protein
MSVKIISRTTQQQLADTGTSVGLNGNVGDYQRIILDVAVSVEAKTSTSLSITVNTDNTWTLSSGTWAQLGFEVSDSITGTLNQTQISTGTITPTAISVTVNAISGNVMTVSGAIFSTIPSNFVVPSTNGDYVLNWMEVKVDKNFTALDLYYNQYLSSITPTLNSFLDGTQSIASASGLDATDLVTVTNMGLNTPKSGGNVVSANIIGLGKTSGVSSFRITLVTIVGGFYDVTTDIQNDTNPTWFAGSENLNDAVKIDFFKAVGNLDAQQLSTIFSWAGNTGWFNENRNVNNGALTLNIGSLYFQDVLGSNFVTSLQSDRKTRVRFFIDAPPNFFVLADQLFNAGIVTCPIDRQQFIGNGFTELQNLVANTMGVEQSYPFGGVVTSSIAGFQNNLGAEVKIERYHFKWLSATRVEIQLDIEPNAQMTSYINSQNVGDRLWALWVSCVDSSGTLMSARRENIMLSGQWLEQVIEPDTLKGGDLFEIYPREGDYYNAPAGMTSNTIITEDDFQGAMRFELDKSEHITNVKCGVEIYNPSDGSRYELDSISQNTTSAPISNDGTQQLDFEINRPFNYVNGFKNKLFTIKRFPALDLANDRGFQIIAAMRFRYEWWLANTNLPTAFFNNTQPFNNLNNEWFTKLAGTLQVRYFQEVTTTNNFYLDAKTLTAINYRDALRDAFTNDITIYENDDFTGSLFVGNKTNKYNGRNFALIDGEPAYLEAKIGKAGATFAHNYVEITLEVEDGQGYLSQWKLRSDQTPSGTNPLRPLSGETTVKITNPADELVAQCWIDTSLLPNNVIDLKITAEFQGVNEGGEGVNSYFNRDIAWASINEKPAPEPDEDCEPNQCDYKLPVFASLSNPTDNYKNDIKGLFAKKSNFITDINFFLIDCDGNEYPLNDNTFGTLFPFGSFTYEPDLKIYQIRWNSVLSLRGPGCYQIKRQVTTIRGGEINFYSCFYDLQPYECEAVEGTIRVESLHNEYNEQLGINFKDINFIDHIRFSGYFGFEQPIHDSTMFVGTNNKKKTNQIDLKSEFTLTSKLVPHKCVTDPLWNFHFMASELFVSDYNVYNHRKYVSFAVYLEEVTSADYFHGNSNAHMSVKFSERTIPRRVRTCVGDRPLPALSESYVYQNQCPIGDLTIAIPYEASEDTSTVTIIANAVGTITAADTTGLTSVVYEVNSSIVTIPFALALNDVLEITYDAAASSGTIILTGTYV